MNILKKFQMAALLVTGMSLGAYAQQKQEPQKAKVKADTTSTYQIKRDSLDRVIFEQKRKRIDFQKDSIAGSKTVTPGALPKKQEKELSPLEEYRLRRSKMTERERQIEDSLYRIPAHREKVERAVEKKQQKEQPLVIPATKEVATDTLKTQQQILIDSVETTHYIYQTDTVEAKPLRKGRPMRILTGPLRQWTMGPKFDPNRDQLGPIDEHYNIVEGPVNGWFFDVVSPAFAEKGFGSIMAAEAFVAIFKPDELEEYITIGETDNAPLYKYSVDQRDLLNYGQLSIRFGKEFGKGFLRVNPYLNLGVHYQNMPELKIDGPEMDRWTENAFEANRVSAFGRVGVDVIGVLFEKEKIKKDEEKGDKTKKNALLFLMNANAFKTTQEGIQTNPYSGVGPYNGDKQYYFYVSGGLAYKF